jgi:hypothetical protein
MRITFWQFKETTGIFEEDETTKILYLFPQEDKKLHSSTSKEETDPCVNKWRGMRMGVEINEETDFEEGRDVRLERYCWRWNGDVEVEEDESKVTWNDKDCHSRPPDPEEELKSNSRSSHTPNELGRDNVTTGGDNDCGEGAEIVRVWDSLKGQREQVISTFEVQRAFITSLLNMSTSPTLTSNQDTGDISRDLSSTHTHRISVKLKEDCMEGENDKGDLEMLNNSSQVFFISDFIEPPSFVESSKVMKILLPSEENWARFIKGPGAESSDPLTPNSEPDENHTV